MKIRSLLCVVSLAFVATAASAADPVNLSGKKGVVDPNDLKNPRPATGKRIDPNDLKHPKPATGKKIDPAYLKKGDPKPPSLKIKPPPKL